MLPTILLILFFTRFGLEKKRSKKGAFICFSTGFVEVWEDGVKSLIASGAVQFGR